MLWWIIITPKIAAVHDIWLDNDHDDHDFNAHIVSNYPKKLNCSIILLFENVRDGYRDRYMRYQLSTPWPILTKIKTIVPEILKFLYWP